MGAGKSTVGRKLASLLGLQFVDCDQEIERRSGVSISWIFDVEGEAGFRSRESQVLAELTKQDACLIATGGGVVLSAENRQRLKEGGLVVYLDVHIDLLVERTTRRKTRPLLQNGLLQGASIRSVLEGLQQQRAPLYRETADIHLVIKDQNIQKTLTKLLVLLQQHGYETAGDVKAGAVKNISEKASNAKGFTTQNAVK